MNELTCPHCKLPLKAQILAADPGPQHKEHNLAFSPTSAGNIEIPGKDATRGGKSWAGCLLSGFPTRCVYCSGTGHMSPTDTDKRAGSPGATCGVCSGTGYSAERPGANSFDPKSPENAQGVSEAGSSQTKIATGTASVSKAKLASFFGGPLPPRGKCSFCGGAHLSEDHTAIGYLGRNEPAPDRLEAKAAPYELPKDPVGAGPKDPLRDALGAFASKLKRASGSFMGRIPDATLEDVEELIILTLETGGKVTLDAAGMEFRSEAAPDRFRGRGH